MAASQCAERMRKAKPYRGEAPHYEEARFAFRTRYSVTLENGLRVTERRIPIVKRRIHHYRRLRPRLPIVRRKDHIEPPADAGPDFVRELHAVMAETARLLTYQAAWLHDTGKPFNKARRLDRERQQARAFGRRFCGHGALSIGSRARSAPDSPGRRAGSKTRSCR